MQIIVNRIAILMPIPAQATRLKWGVFGILLAVNISVFCIWIPARLQINETYIHINEIWDRIEKGIFLLVDAGLNLTFIYLVKSRLIASGLTKYTALFRFNLAMIAVSMSLDVGLVAFQLYLIWWLIIDTLGHPHWTHVPPEHSDVCDPDLKGLAPSLTIAAMPSSTRWLICSNYISKWAWQI